MSKLIKYLILFLILVLIILSLVLFGINRHLNSNEEKIIDGIEGLWNGKIEFQSAKVDLIRSFPSASCTFRNVLITDSLYEDHLIPTIKLEELIVQLSLKEILKKEIEIKSLILRNGVFNHFIDKNAYDNIASILPEIQKDNQDNKKIKVKRKNLKILLEKIDFSFTDEIKNKRINGKIKKANTKLDFKEEYLSVWADVDLIMGEMGLNLEKGTFFNGASVSGKFDAHVDLETKEVEISPFRLKLNEQGFLVSAAYSFMGDRNFIFTLENDITHFKQTEKMLAQNIQERIAKFDVDGPFYTKTIIEGQFKFGIQPRVNVYFEIDGQDISVKDRKVKNAKLKANLYNRLEQGQPLDFENGRNIRIDFESLKGNFEGINLDLKNSLVKSFPDSTTLVDLDLRAFGKPEKISKLLKNDQFLFSKGRFDLHMLYKGEIKSFESLVLGSKTKLKFSDFVVSYLPVNASFPVTELMVEKNEKDSKFELISSTSTKNHEFKITGNLDNFPSLIIDNPKVPASSSVELTANKLGWQDLLDLIGEDGILKQSNFKVEKTKEKTKNVKQMLLGLNESFHPRLKVKIDTLLYSNKIEMHDFESGIYYQDDYKIVLEDSKFEFEKGKVDFNASMNLKDSLITPFELSLTSNKINLEKILPPFGYFDVNFLENLENLPENIGVKINHTGILRDHEGIVPNTSMGQIDFTLDNGKTLKGRISYEPDLSKSSNSDLGQLHVQTNIEIEGNPELVNDFFKSDEFFFRSGKFKAGFSYTGDVRTLPELLKKSRVNFELIGSEVYYAPAEVALPINSINLRLHDEIADFEIFSRIDSWDRELLIEGKLKNFGTLAFPENSAPISTAVLISSPLLVWEDFLGLFQSGNSLLPTKKVKQERSAGLKKTLQGLLEQFNPRVRVIVDAFELSPKIKLLNCKTGLRLDESNKLVFDNTGFKYERGSVELDAVFDLNNEHVTPFQTNFKTQKLDVAKFMESFDFFGVKALQDIEKLTGEITLDVDLSGEILDSTGLVPEATKGFVNFTLDNVGVKGFEGLEKVANKVFRKTRFEDIHFAPISNTLKVDGRYVNIPLMVIQSTAMDMFLEGDFNYGNKTNIWISIPMNNLRKRDGLTLPEKIGYLTAGDKVYVEVFTNSKMESEFKFHLNKKKFYEQRGIMHRYQEEKRIEKKAKKAEKKRR